MSTQDIYQKTLKYAGEKHANQLVPGSTSNYLLHISNVVMEVIFAHKENEDFNLNFAVQVAILHDVIEDTLTDFNEVKNIFGSDVANAVMALTKNEKLATKFEKMADSLNRIKNQPKEVAIVKLADRITNLQKPPQNWNNDKIKSYYEEAKQIKNQLMGCNTYLEKRLALKLIEYKTYF